MARNDFTRPAPFGVETSLSAVRAVEGLLTGFSQWAREIRFATATNQVPERVLSDAGLHRVDTLDVRYSQISARV